MKTLNLVYKEKSDISYEVQRFPDGQQDIIIKTVYGKTHIIGWEEEKFTIKSHFNPFRDLELIICAVKDYQLDVIERASNTTDDAMKQHIMRFHKTQKTLKVVGYAKHSNCYYEFNKDIQE